MKFLGRRGKKTYMFADDIIASDTIISFAFGIVALILIVFSVIYSIVKKGLAGEAVGVLLAASFIMSTTALLFGIFSYRQPEGGNTSKRFSVIVSIVGLVLEIAIIAL